MNDRAAPGTFDINNIRQFVFFRVFFNSRFYYPIFTILFIDFGLTLTQFALLNVAWAVTIVLFEVPSGALADIIGRRKLVVSAGALMVVEMAILCFAPKGNPDLLFIFFLVNRVLSGAAEAAASGADEALAYDALKMEGDAKNWGRVLERQMRVRALVSMAAMTIGAAVYDPALMNAAADFLGLNFTFTQDVTLRFPLYLTFIMALFTLRAALKMQEVDLGEETSGAEEQSFGASVIEAFKLTLKAGHWILKTPFALLIILSCLLFDHVMRMLITLNSQYYRLIQLPEASFGLISSAHSVLGIFIPSIALFLVQRYSPARNLYLTAGLTFIGMLGMTFFWPYFGLIPALILFSGLYLIAFYSSHYLNQITESHQRATVLSFKGLSFNLAYGLIGIMYSLLLALLRSKARAGSAAIEGEQLENLVFIESFQWFPWYFLLTFAALLVFSKWLMKKSDVGAAVHCPPRKN